MGFHTAAGGREECQLKDLTPLWPVLCVFDEQVARNTSTLSTAFFPSDFRRQSDTLCVRLSERDGKRKEKSFCWLDGSQFADCSVCGIYHRGSVQFDVTYFPVAILIFAL